jgi:antitoxin component YwqK of YwqJK toxin-antitoxin module
MPKMIGDGILDEEERSKNYTYIKPSDIDSVRKHFHDCMKAGTLKEWFENGKLKSETIQDANGSQIIKEYFDSGQLKKEIIRSNRKIINSLTIWYENGKLRERNIFTDGKIVTKKTWNSNSVNELEILDTNDNDAYIVRIFYSHGQIKNELSCIKEDFINRVLNFRNIEYIDDFDQNNIREAELWPPLSLFGQGIIKWIDSQTKEETDRHLKHGECKSWTISGNIKSVENFKKNKKNGVCKLYHDNGNLAKEMYYQNDILHGEYKEWNINGIITGEKIFDNGVLIDSKEYSANFDYKITDKKRNQNWLKRIKMFFMD